MIKNASQTDRYILISSIGIILISLCITFDRVQKQELEKERIYFAQQESHKKETLNIKTWRRYHEKQMILMQKILVELKSQNQDSVWMQPSQKISSQNVKVR